MARRKITVWLAVLPALLLLIGTSVSANAATPSLGGLTFSPASGSDISTIDFTTVSSGTAKGCPSATTNVRGLVNGPGGWANILVLTNSTSGLSTTSDFTIGLADTFEGLAQSNGLAIVAGTYNIQIICQNRTGGTQYGTFDAPIYFTSPTQYQTTDPAHPATATTTTLSVSPSSPQAAGTAVTFTANVSPSGATGSVQFKEDGTDIGAPQTVSAGSAHVTENLSGVGTHSLTAVFTPSGSSFLASTAAPVTYVITGSSSAAATTTSLAVTPASPAQVGAAVTFTASVSPTAPGTVQFKDGSANLGSSQTVSAGSASMTTSALAAGPHSIIAEFVPTNLALFVGSTSDALAYTISGSPSTTPASATSTSISASPTSMAGAGTTVTFAAAVSPASAAGTVQFEDGSTALGSPQTVSAGQASFATNGLSAATHSISAVFTPTDSSAYLASTAPALTYVVIASTGAATTTTLAANPPSPSASGVGVTFTATVSPPVGGTVQFEDGTSPIGVPQTLAAGQATISTSTLGVGSHSVTAGFTPSDAGANAASVSSPVIYVVTSAPANVLGTLTFSPSVGLDASTIDFTTHSTGTSPGCPVGTTNVRAVVNGPSGWSDILVLTNSTSGLSTTADFVVPMADTFIGVATSNGLVVTAGRYDFTLFCQNRTGAVRFGTYAGSLFFTDATHYQSTDPSNTVVSTTTALSVGPDARQDIGKPITLNATVTPDNAVGSVQFTDTTQGLTANIGAAVPLPLGANAVAVVSTLPFGLHTFAATFIPADSRHFSASTSQSIVYVVALPPPPRLVQAAHLLGNGRLGSVMTCASTITGATSISYSWYRNGKVIRGVASGSYRLAAADRVTLLACRVTARSTGGTTQSMSRPAFVALLTMRLLSAPAVYGHHIVGAVVYTDAGRWSPVPNRTSYRYEWLRDGKAIRGAARQSYKVTKADVGHRLSVRVTVGALFYNSATAVSRSF